MNKTFLTLLVATASTFPIVKLQAQTYLDSKTDMNTSADINAGNEFSSRARDSLSDNRTRSNLDSQTEVEAENNARINTQAGSDTMTRSRSGISKDVDTSAYVGVGAEAETNLDSKAQNSMGQTRATSSNNLGVGVDIGNEAR